MGHGLRAKVAGGCRRLGKRWAALGREALCTLRDEEGQGTTEYAILVGVLVLIAIVAILAFRDKISELWNSIASGINSL